VNDYKNKLSNNDNLNKLDNSTIDQPDGIWKSANKFAENRLTNNNFINNKIHSNMYSSLNADNLNLLYAQNFAKNQPINKFNNQFMNPLSLGESQSNSLTHSEPSSPEGLSSASSTSSRCSSLGYYSGSSLNGVNNLNLPFPLNSNIASTFYSNLYNQTSSKQAAFNLQTAPPSYASLNFKNHNNSKLANKQSSFIKNSSNQQRPSVIVSSTSKNRNQFASTKIGQTDLKESAVDSIDEHFRLSLGNNFSKILNNQSTPSKESFKSKQSSVDDHFNRSLNRENSSTVIESSTSVDDHFAKSLGDAWFELKKKIHLKF